MKLFKILHILCIVLFSQSVMGGKVPKEIDEFEFKIHSTKLISAKGYTQEEHAEAILEGKYESLNNSSHVWTCVIQNKTNCPIRFKTLPLLGPPMDVYLNPLSQALCTGVNSTYHGEYAHGLPSTPFEMNTNLGKVEGYIRFLEDKATIVFEYTQGKGIKAGERIFQFQND